jgi:hypothetical protein
MSPSLNWRDICLFSKGDSNSSGLSRRVSFGKRLSAPFNLSDNFLMNFQVDSFIIKLLFQATLLANCYGRGLVYGNNSNPEVRIWIK